MARRATLWLWALFFLFGAASSAHAAIVVVLPPQLEAGLVAEASEAASAELVRLIKAHGFDVISSGQASAAAEDAQQSGSFSRELNPHDCRSAGCASEYRNLFDASFTVQLVLAGRADKIVRVQVNITDSPTTLFDSSVVVAGGDLKGAVQDAYRSAREKHLRGEGPWLSAAGTPVGAVVYVDGLEYGRIPFERRHIEAGGHRIEVRQDGFVSQVEERAVPSNVAHEERVEVALATLEAPAAPVARELDRTWDYVVGGVIAAASAVHLGMGIQQKLESGDCATRDGTRCTDRYGDDSGPKRENMLLGFGAAGVALGAIVIGVAPIGRLTLSVGRDTALLTLRQSF